MSGPDKTKPGAGTPPTRQNGRATGGGTGKDGGTGQPSRSLFARKGAASAEGFEPFPYDTRHMVPAEMAPASPPAPEPPDPGAAAAAGAAIQAAPKKILIVEDDALNMKLFHDV